VFCSESYKSITFKAKTCNGEAAISFLMHNDDQIHLLLTDVVMPRISGRQLAESASILCNMKVLYIPGYTADLIAQHGILEPQFVLLEKPFTKEALLRKIRKVLDTARPGCAAAAP
jgi:two-component system cell cycle sensor histidine kinase/response regulator CckA